MWCSSAGSGCLVPHRTATTKCEGPRRPRKTEPDGRTERKHQARSTKRISGEVQDYVSKRTNSDGTDAGTLSLGVGRMSNLESQCDVLRVHVGIPKESRD